MKNGRLNIERKTAMTCQAPSFLDSPYLVEEPGNWHLKPGAPEALKKEFEEFMKETEDNEPEPVTKPQDQ